MTGVLEEAFECNSAEGIRVLLNTSQKLENLLLTIVNCKVFRFQMNNSLYVWIGQRLQRHWLVDEKKWIEKRLHGIVKPEYINTISNDFMDVVRVMVKKGPIKD